MKKLIYLLTIMFAFSSGGCSSVVPIIGPIISFALVWKNGEAQKYYKHDSATVYRAAKRALQQMEIPITRDDNEINGNYYLIGDVHDRFKISIDRVENKITRLSLRIDTMGDKPYGELFYQYVDKELSVIQFDPEGNPVICK